jgi:phosphoribosylformylglycinamidine synthase subunit PurL
MTVTRSDRPATNPEAGLPASGLFSRALALGLSERECERICELLGREPNEVELAVFSLLWSEHCAYKHSRKLLRKLPTDGESVLAGPGENAGVVDAGDGLAVAFKVESHNHPSAVEPFQGAATGVGGILRDVFALGARPVAVLDSLRFGEPDGPRSRYLLDRVVAGISAYGNSVGVPTVGGEIYFEAPYEQNCLVNAMAVGLLPADRIVRSAASGPGNVVVLLGARTGRDGIGGASVLASAELTEGDHEKRPSVQIGDPLEENKLIECCLELVEQRLVVALQDLGAAGLASSTSEMAAKGSVGIDLDVSRVPLREADMEPFEIMISESQERMLCVVEPERLDAVLALCAKWEVNASPIGTVTDSGHLRVFQSDRLVGDVPVSALVDECPLYDLEPERPADPLAAYPRPPARLAPSAAADETFLALLGSPNIASRRPVFEQYDFLVGSRTVRRPEAADAAVLRLAHSGRDTGRAIAVSIDGNGRRVACDPYVGAAEAVCECAANLACAGAEPLGLTNCLNFGNPEKPHVAWQLTRTVDGMAAACRALDVPVVGGNVSLYNEGPEGPIYPSPVVGMVGELPDPARAGRIAFQAPDGEPGTVALLGPVSPSVAGSELAKLRGDLVAGLPHFDLAKVRRALELVRAAVRDGTAVSAHDVSDGGLACAAAECAIAGGVGVTLDLNPLLRREDIDATAALFGEGPGGLLVSGPRELLLELSSEARDVGFLALGSVGGDAIRLTAADATIDVLVEDARGVFESGLRRFFP